MGQEEQSKTALARSQEKMQQEAEDSAQEKNLQLVLLPDGVKLLSEEELDACINRDQPRPLLSNPDIQDLVIKWLGDWVPHNLIRNEMVRRWGWTVKDSTLRGYCEKEPHANAIYKMRKGSLAALSAIPITSRIWRLKQCQEIYRLLGTPRAEAELSMDKVIALKLRLMQYAERETEPRTPLVVGTQDNRQVNFMGAVGKPVMVEGLMQGMVEKHEKSAQIAGKGGEVSDATGRKDSTERDGGAGPGLRHGVAAEDDGVEPA